MVVCDDVTRDAVKNYFAELSSVNPSSKQIESIEPWEKLCEVPRRNALIFRETFLHIFLFSRPLFRSLFVFGDQKSEETNNRFLAPETNVRVSRLVRDGDCYRLKSVGWAGLSHFYYND